MSSIPCQAYPMVYVTLVLWDNMGLNYTDLITKLVELLKEVKTRSVFVVRRESGTEMVIVRIRDLNSDSPTVEPVKS